MLKMGVVFALFQYLRTLQPLMGQSPLLSGMILAFSCSELHIIVLAKQHPKCSACQGTAFSGADEIFIC